MLERLTEELFKAYLESEEIPCTLRKLSDKEKEYWDSFKEVKKKRERIKEYGIYKKCVIAFNGLDNPLDVIALLMVHDSIYYIGTDNEKIIENFNNVDDVVLVTDTATLTPELLFNLKNIEGKKCKTDVPKAPEVSSDLNDYQIIDRSLVDYEKYMNHIGQAMVNNCMSLQFSRGCQFNCAYCQKVYLSGYRNRSAENLFEELSMYYRLGVKRFAFVDDLPNFNKREGIKFLKMLYESKMRPQLFFPNGIRGDILDEEYIDYMIQAGTVNIDLALETASPRLQRLINKNLNIESLKRNIEYIIKNYPDVILELQMMIGLPTETVEEATSSLEFIKNLKWIDFPYMHILKIYPNTPMADLALKNGISEEEIAKSNSLGYHELPGTLPFSKMFVKKCQSDFLNNYVMNKDRLKTVIKKQEKILTEQEMLQKYDSYLPMSIKSINDLEEITGISDISCADEKKYKVKDLNSKIKSISPVKQPDREAVRMLFLDLTFNFEETDKIYHVVEAPLGQMYILSYVNKKLGSKVSGKILKSGIDYKSINELNNIISEFKPDFIGVRGMNYYKYWVHYTIFWIRQCGYKGLVAVGGPYATSYYQYLLNDQNINFAMVGEGEETVLNVAKSIISHKEHKIIEIPGVVAREGDKSAKKGIYIINNLG